MPFVIDKFKSKNGASVSEEFKTAVKLIPKIPSPLIQPHKKRRHGLENFVDQYQKIVTKLDCKKQQETNFDVDTFIYYLNTIEQ